MSRPWRLGGWCLAALALGLAHPAEGQGGFQAAVEEARRAWATQDAPGILGGGRQVLLQLPGSEGRSELGRAQAIRLIEGFLGRAEGVEVRVLQAREVGPGQGYAELLRRYRVAGTAEARSQRILLAYRWEPDRGVWALVELRVLVGGG